MPPEPPRPRPEKATVPNQRAVTEVTDARVFRPLPEGATLEQIIHALQEQGAAYATVAHALTHRLPNIEHLLDELKRSLNADRLERQKLAADVDELGNELSKDLRQLTARVFALETSEAMRRADALPPMRSESKSSHDLAKHVSKDAVAAIEAYARNPSTPPGPPDKATMEKIIEERASTLLAIRDAERLRKAEEKQLEDARLAALADAALKRDIRLRTWITILAIIAAVVTAIVSALVPHTR
jgi:hypothetical protein